jgi:hypothetical protein
MELRRHPGMMFHGVCNCPPVWLHSRADALGGEIGVLKYVHASNRLSNKCYLVIEHERTLYIGCLIFNDISFCCDVAKLLRQYHGRSVEEFGGLELSHLL